MKSFILPLLVLVLLGCAPQPTITAPPGAQCTSEADCTTGGCSSQLCVPKAAGPIITTCEWREEYGCLKLTSCSCINFTCQWAQTQTYQECLAQLST